MQYYGQRQQAATAAAVGDYNARVSEADAAQVDMEARENLSRKRKANQSFLSRQRASYVASGVVGDVGTPLEVQAETAGLLELEALDADRVAKNQSARLRSGAVFERASGQAQKSAYNMAAGTSLLTGVGDIAGRTAGYMQNGTFKGGGKKDR